ncbi:MAG: MFS transporter [Candidatus Rokubacteria bacterium]|nr:MFS transporter [Candidatus Rokubacteria bacterium]
MTSSARHLIVPCLAAAAQSFAFTNHAPLVPLMIADLGISPTEAGLLTTAAFVTAGALSVPLGGLTDRIGPKRVTALAMTLLAIATAGLALTSSLSVMLLTRALAGVSLATVFIAGGGYVNAWWTGERQFLAQGLHGGAVQLGIGLGLLTLPAIGERLGWRTAIGVSAVVIVVSLVHWQAMARPTPPAPARAPLGSVLGNATIWRLGLVHTATFGLAILLGTWIATYLVHEFALSLATAGVLGSVGLVIGAVGRPLGGIVVARRYAAPRTLILTMLGAATVGLGLLAWPARPLALAITGIVLVGVAAAFAYAPVVALAARSAPDSAGAALGLISLVATPGVIIGAPLVGALLTASGGFTVPWAVLMVIPAATLVATTRLPR